MHVRLSSPQIEALKATLEIPDNLMNRVRNVTAEGDGFQLTLSEDEAMAMTEMCQWYIKKDPATGQLGPKAVVFDAIVRAIYAAQDG